MGVNRQQLIDWAFDRRGSGAERNAKLARDFRPEFAQDVESGVLQDVRTHLPGDGACAVRGAGMIDIAEKHSRSRARPFRNIGHALAIIAMRNERMFERVQQAAPSAAAAQPVIPGILEENRGKQKL